MWTPSEDREPFTFLGVSNFVGSRLIVRDHELLLVQPPEGVALIPPVHFIGSAVTINNKGSPAHLQDLARQAVAPRLDEPCIELRSCRPKVDSEGRLAS